LAVPFRPILLFALQGGQPGLGTEAFQRLAVFALDSLQRPGDVVELVDVLGLQFGAVLEVHLCVFLPAQPQVAQAAEIIAAGIAATGANGRSEGVIGLLIVLRKVGVYADSVSLTQDRVLGDDRRKAQQDQAGGQ
jgi:hypothetical protein